MPRSPLGWALTVAVPAIALALAFIAAGGSGSGASGPQAGGQAAAICRRAELELKQIPQQPQSVAEALEMLRRGLAVYRRELADLHALAPRTNDAFRAGLAADRQLLHAYSAMIERPDFVHLSLTLPDHPELAPPWLKRWLARQKQHLSEAQQRFSEAGVPACEHSLGSTH